MSPNAPFDRCLLALYRRAMRERRWTVAEHLLSAIESSALPDRELGNGVAQAYRAIAMMAAELRPDTLQRSASPAPSSALQHRAQRWRTLSRSRAETAAAMVVRRPPHPKP